MTHCPAACIIYYGGGGGGGGGEGVKRRRLNYRLNSLYGERRGHWEGVVLFWF